MLNPIYGLCLYMVFGSGFPDNCVESYRLLGLIFLSHCVESHIWSLPIYGLWSGFPVPTVLNSIVFWVWFSCPTVLNPIYGLCPYMVSGSGFLANCVESYRLLGLIFLSHCVESHIWSLPIYGLWVWFSCQLC